MAHGSARWREARPALSPQGTISWPLIGRYPARFAPQDSFNLGSGIWCRYRLEEAEARLNVNLADGPTLGAFFGDDSLAAALLDWRDQDDIAREGGAESEWYREEGRRLPRNGPLADVAELRLVRGFDPWRPEWDTLLTVKGSGRLDLNSAPVRLLSLLPGFSDEALEAIAFRRRGGGTFASLDELAGSLSPEGRRLLLSAYADLARGSVTTPPMWLAHIEGGVAGSRVSAPALVTVVPDAGRLAVVAREAW